MQEHWSAIDGKYLFKTASQDHSGRRKAPAARSLEGKEILETVVEAEAEQMTVKIGLVCENVGRE